MGCLNTNRVIKINSTLSFKKENKKTFIVKDIEVPKEAEEQSQIIIDARIENNELIFL